MSNETPEATTSSFFELLERDDFVEGVCWHCQHFDDNEVILREGEYSGKVFLILEGTVRILGDVPMGDDYHVRPGVNDLGAGDMFGEFSLLDRDVHSATVMAVSPCRLAVVDNQCLLDYLDSHHDLGFQIYREIALSLVRRMRAADKKIFSLLAWGFKAHGFDKYMKADI